MRVLLSLLATLALSACSTGGNNGGTDPVPNKQCVSPLGGLLNHGQTVTMYKDAQVTAPAQCESEVRTCNDGALSGSYLNASCSVGNPADTEPATHEQPMRINDKDLKVGGIKTVGSMSTLASHDPSNFSPAEPLAPACQNTMVMGSPCSRGMPSCSQGGKNWTCETKTTYKVFGWVYEEIGRDYKPAEGVKADIFWFAGCIVGACDSLAGPVRTDKWGYFELLTTALLDTVRLDGLDVGLYAFCNKGKPIAGGGSALGGRLDKPFADAFANQKRIKPDSCLQ